MPDHLYYTREDLEAEIKATRTQMRWYKEREEHLAWEGVQKDKRIAELEAEIKKLRFYVSNQGDERLKSALKQAVEEERLRANIKAAEE